MFGRSKSKRDSAPPAPEQAAPEPATPTPHQVSGNDRAPDAASRSSARKADSGTGAAMPAETPATAPQDQAARRRAAIAIRHSVAFSQIVSLLMRSAEHRRYPIAALESLVLPPLLTGQFRIAEAKSKQNGVSVPVAVALWARVSAEVDKRLAENLDKPMQLRPRDWRSGDQLWLIEVVGDQRALPHFLRHLRETLFKGRDVKMRTRGSDGKVAVRSLAEIATGK
jgi:hemolysin-activating ACP:hemolysin acyltransferase